MAVWWALCLFAGSASLFLTCAFLPYFGGGGFFFLRKDVVQVHQAAVTRILEQRGRRTIPGHQKVLCQGPTLVLQGCSLSPQLCYSEAQDSGGEEVTDIIPALQVTLSLGPVHSLIYITSYLRSRVTFAIRIKIYNRNSPFRVCRHAPSGQKGEG